MAPNRSQLHQKSIFDLNQAATSFLNQFFITFPCNKKTNDFLMFLHNRHLLIYENFTFDSYLKNPSFWLPKSIKIVPQTYKNWYCFFHWLFCCFSFDFGSVLEGFWDVYGCLLPPTSAVLARKSRGKHRLQQEPSLRNDQFRF